jgi:signal peptidase
MTTTLPTRRDLRLQAVERAADARTHRAPRRAGSAVGDLLLWIAACGGAVCVGLVILAFTAQITLIMFSTGSMSPTIPTGSVAVVQRIPASEARVGDIVTVDRAGNLPVTHRITSIEPGSHESERVITMRGDANADDDPFPYTVSSVRRVLFSIPGVATVIVGMGNPYVLSGITVAAALLVVWAFWPRRPDPAAAGDHDGRRP